jgi:hypothetical protein
MSPRPPNQGDPDIRTARVQAGRCISPEHPDDKPVAATLTGTFDPDNLTRGGNRPGSKYCDRHGAILAQKGMFRPVQADVPKLAKARRVHG